MNVYDFTVKDRKGNDVSLADYKGKVLGVNAVREDGADVPVNWEREPICDTVLVEYWSTGEHVTLTLALGT